jgi:Fe-S cluster assembly protein SufD
MRDGFAIRVSSSVEASQPVEIVHIHTDQSAPTSIFPRTIVSVESSGALTCIERFVTLNQSVNLCVAVTEIIVGDGARVDYYAEAEHTPATTHYHSVQTQSGRDAQLRMHLFPSGAKICRNEVNVHLLGTGSHTLLNGLSLPRDSQQIDTSTVIRHAVPHCESSELFKGVYRDRSRGVFQGTIIVEKDAQKTNAFQSNQAVLLSKEASSDAKPQLKIWADDVKCTHGATVGQLDEEALFYIRSRGVAPSDAQNMLLEAFVGEVLGGVKVESLRDRVRARVM